MANLAIKGHATRGKEVIEILEMLGGINTYHLKGEKPDNAYYIEVDRSICCIDIETKYHTGFYKISLEQFEEKFSYKVGNKVMTDDGDKAIIVGMVWDNDIDDVFYEIRICNEVFKYPKELLQPYKEETMEEINIVKIGFNGDKAKLILPDEYEFKTEGKEVYVVKKKPQYPKTYEECCEVLFHSIKLGEVLTSGYNCELLKKLGELLICRDAYWKIAGEQMGLRKPWKPDYDSGVNKYGIICINGVVQKSNPTTNWERHLNKVLDFPTKEMRDAFYENFRELIEGCDEFL